MRQFRKIVTEYESESRELAEFVPELANSEAYLCSKFEEGLSLEIREKISISGSQSYKEVVQLALKAEKLNREKRSRGSFQKRKGLGFTSEQSSKKSHSSDFFGNSSRSGTDSVISPQSIRSSQSSKLGTTPQVSTSRGITMSEKCPYCRQYLTRTYGTPQVCFQCRQICHVKRFLLDNE